MKTEAASKINLDSPSEDTIIHQDCSTLSKYLKPWWIFSASLLPNNLAPNVITFFGGIIMILSGCIAFFSQESWTLLFHSFAIFAFQTLDALDGIQARKLKASSKLGNYIDHTTDIITLQIMFQVLFQTLQLNTHYIILATLFGNFNIYLTHWETAETNILYFPNGFSITELQIQCIAIHLLTYFIPTIWNTMIYLPLNNILIIVILFSNVCFVTFPLLKRVMGKNKLEEESKFILDAASDKLISLIPLIMTTIGLMIWSFNTNTDYMNLVIFINVPYTLMTGRLLLFYLGFTKNMHSKFINLIPVLLILFEFLPYRNILIELSTLVILFITIINYLKSILYISHSLNVSILTIKQT